MSHYCHICGRNRSNEKFSGRGHRDHVCKDCQRMPRGERDRIERIDELLWLSQSVTHLTKKRRAFGDPRSACRQPSQAIGEFALGSCPCKTVQTATMEIPGPKTAKPLCTPEGIVRRRSPRRRSELLSRPGIAILITLRGSLPENFRFLGVQALKPLEGRCSHRADARNGLRCTDRLHR